MIYLFSIVINFVFSKCLHTHTCIFNINITSVSYKTRGFTTFKNQSSISSMTLFAGSTSSSNKIKINSYSTYPHSCSHSVVHAVTHTEPTRSFFRSFTSCFNRAGARARASIVEGAQTSNAEVDRSYALDQSSWPPNQSAPISPREKPSYGRLQGAKRVALVDSLYDQPFVSFAHSRDSPRPLRSPSVSFHVFLLPRHRFAAAIRSDSAP